MDFNSRLFDRIRIKPTADEPRASARQEPVCEKIGCGLAGAFRAPKGRGKEGQYWRFCLDHVREYNASYNYFTGMTDDAVAAFQKDAVKDKDGPSRNQRRSEASQPEQRTDAAHR